MHNSIKMSALRRSLLGAASVVAVSALAAPAWANDGPPSASDAPGGETPAITVRDDVSFSAPPPAGIYDSATNFTGVGQVVTDQGGGFVGTCTGTLINPRTVIFAAHCVNTQAASSYGQATGGKPISVGFSFNNLNPLLQWLGFAPGTPYATNAANGLYNVEQVWFDPRSLAPASNGFLEADIALATLDTPAFDIPSWAMLFSPLTSAEHAVIAGYGNTGSGTAGVIGSDWRRRAAENMLSFLGSLNDRNLTLFGATAGLPQNLYMMDFDDPKYGAAGANPRDFNIFGGAALPHEGITGPGDSGGPIIIDQKYDRPVIAGTLSGGSTFFAGQRQGSYGTHNLYQPLFLFWDQIVANNSYVYAGNRAGIGDWTDPSRWVQLMDPNYTVERGGALVNDLPDTPALGVSGDTVQFGSVCFHADCETPVGTAAPIGSGVGLSVAGGPGSLNFVPDNVVANPAAGVRARYYDVALSAPGLTRLNSAVTIDRFTMNGFTGLDVRSAGSLKVWGDYTQWNGWTNVDGMLRSGEMLVVNGLLSGSGTIDPTYLTVVQGVVAPGGVGSIGTLTVNSDMILSSGSALLVDASRAGADLLAVGGLLSLSDPADAAAGGASIIFNKGKGAAPRHGDSFVIATATGGVQGTFGAIHSFQGVLRPELTYEANSITALLRAGSLKSLAGGRDSIANAFAGALDALRSSSYNQLYGLYGAVDLMGAEQLSMTLKGLAPNITGETRALQDRQSRVMLSAVTDRLSSLGTHSMRPGLSIVGTPGALGMARNGQAVQQSFANLVPRGSSLSALPKGVTGFVSGGVTSGSASYGDSHANMQGRLSTHIGMGLETEVAQGLTVGTAFGYANGHSAPGVDRTESKTSQLAVYGSYQLGDGAYLAGVASAEGSRANLQRQATTGDVAFDLHGATNSARYNVMAEAGVNLGLARGITLTPRAQLAYDSYSLGGFREKGGETALQMDSLRLERIEARMGAKLAGARGLGGGWTFVPTFQADYVRLLSGANDGMNIRFANAGDYVFALPLAGGDGNWGEARGGFTLARGKLEFGAGVETAIGRSDVRDDRAVADFTARF